LLAHQLRYLVGDACQPPAPIEQFSATSDAPTWSQGDFIHDLYGNGKINGYERNHNGSYWVYNPSKPTAAALVDSVNYDGTPSL